jgi:branched-subunit amino acid aminotransferase/4-amino-4-deoxychorismate lyase
MGMDVTATPLARRRRREVSSLTRLAWTREEGFRPADDPGEVRLIDSWLVSDGRVRALDAHLHRFTAAVADLYAIPAGEFTLAVAARLPQSGRWFPRVELAEADGAPRFQLWLRPAPATGRAVRLWVPDGEDERSFPRVKGPDLEYLGRLREAAVNAGADEAVLMSGDGLVLEGATTSLLWWRSGELCAPPPDAPVVPGVTRSLLLEAAAGSGVPVRYEYATPAELAGLEVWAVNALHGIRPVTGWVRGRRQRREGAS